MRTLGVDLASRPKKTAICEIAWRDEAALVATVAVGVTDPIILVRARNLVFATPGDPAGDAIGIDAPSAGPNPQQVPDTSGFDLADPELQCRVQSMLQNRKSSEGASTMNGAHPRFLQGRLALLLFLSLAALSMAGTMRPVQAQTTDIASVAQDPGLSAALHEGDCTAIGALAAPFTNAILPPGSPVGNLDALPAANSFTTVPLPLEVIFGTDYAIVVAGPADSGVLACGEVGGSLAEDGSLAIGLASEQSSGVDGIAFLSPGGDGVSTGVSLFLTVPGGLTQAPAPNEPTPALVAEQTMGEEVPIDSGGLGLPIDEFYARYGESVPDTVMYGEVIPAANGRIRVGAAGNEKVNSVTRYFDQGVTFEEARATGLGFAPADSVLVQSYTTSVGSTADVYFSAALATQFTETQEIDDMEFPTWVNGEPGQFIIGYGGYNPANGVNEVTRIVMALGNNP